MSIEQEFFNQLFPIGNTPGVRPLTAVEVNATGGVLDLNRVFGGTGSYNFLTAKAEGVPSGHAVYIAASPNPTYMLRPEAVFGGTGNAGPSGICWSLQNGQEVRGRLPAWGVDTHPTGASIGYGATAGYRATLTVPNFLHYRGSPNMPTGAVLRVMRSSVPWGGPGIGEHMKPPT